jgi:endoglucanase
MAMDTVELLRRLTSAFGPSGFEDAVRETIREIVEPLVDDVRVDTLGNLIATKRGRGDSVLMLDAHMDEIGFMVTYVEEGGFLRFTTLGGWDARIVPSHAMTIRSDDGSFVKGMIGTAPPHVLRAEDREKPFKLDDLFIDIGATSADEVAALGIHTGSPAVIAYPFEPLNDRVVMSKAIDDRAGCAVLIRTLEALAGEELDVTVVANFAVQEEVGLRGAETAAYQIDPDIAIAVEGTIAADVPGIAGSRTPTRQGRGPAISVLDNSMIGNPTMVNALRTAADEAGIPWQYKVPAPGGTDAGIIHRTRAGVLAGVVSMPCRYIHSPYAVLRLEDFENAHRLVTEFARRSAALVEA